MKLRFNTWDDMLLIRFLKPTCPVSEADLVRLEGGLGVRLPSDYREFLLQIGYGAGPFKMWSPDEILTQPLDDLLMLLEDSESVDDLAAFCETDDVDDVKELQKFLLEYKRQYPGPPLPSRPFPFNRAQAEEYNRSVPEESNSPWRFGLYPANGSITIADDGGFHYYVLVVTGDAAGSIWEVCGEVLYDWRPARRPHGLGDKWARGSNPLPAISATATFLEWYCSWIEQLLVDLCADPGGYLNLGLVFQRMGEYSASIENWDKAIEMTPGNSLAYYYRGLVFQELQQMAEAAADFKRCLLRNPDPWTRARAEEHLGKLGGT